ncbi:MAG: hypothetical protein KBT31_03245, partial [Firmicutes bacterium]|nr:hypothetical protein [Candidatus Colimorpha enterica]
MKPHCEKATAEIMRHKGDDTYIEEKKKTYEGVMHNMFVLPGSMGKPIDVGTPIAWHEVRTADQEYIWHLNRMYYLVDLTEIFLLTGEK